jgi:transposase-like protein
MVEVKNRAGRKINSPETRAQALDDLDRGETLKAVSEKYGVSIPTLSSWKRSRRPSAKGSSGDDIELLKPENEYLKKKVAYYESRA